MTIRLRAGSPWVALVAVAVIAASARDITSSLSIDNLGLLMLTVLGLAVLVVQARLTLRRRRIIVDREALQVTGGREPLCLAAKNVVAIETFETRQRVDTNLVGRSRISFFGVRARTDDGNTTPLAGFRTLEACWWLQQVVEQSLGQRERKTTG